MQPRPMIGDSELNQWFCREVLPLERQLTHYIRRNLKPGAGLTGADLVDARQEIYVRVLIGARKELPMNAQAYLYTVARNHLINLAVHSRVVSVDYIAELDDAELGVELSAVERRLDARHELRRTMAALEQLPARCREVVRLRKIEGWTTKEAAERMGVGVDTIEKQLTNGMRAIADFMLGGTGKIKRPARGRDGKLGACDHADDGGMRRRGLGRSGAEDDGQ